MVRIQIRMLWIPFKWFKFEFESFLLVRIRIRMLRILSTSSNLHSNPIRIVRICIRMLRITFEWFKFGFERLESLSNSSFAFECFGSLSTGSNLHSNPIRIVRIYIWMVQIGFECLKSLSKGLNLHSNASNFVWLVPICARMVRIPIQ